MNGTTQMPDILKANIDSLNISHPDLLEIFKHKEEYKVIRIYPSSIEEKSEKEHYYRTCFGKSFYNTTKEGRKVCPFSEIYIIHSERGVAFPVKRHNKTNDFAYTAEFAGLMKYDEKSVQLCTVLMDIWDDIQDYKINRVDIAIDFPAQIPYTIISSILKKRVAISYLNTIYYRKPKQIGKSSGHVDILSYDKKKKDNNEELSGYDKVNRLEFRFFSNYFRNDKLTVKDLAVGLEKMEKFILTNAGIHIKTSKLNVKKAENIPGDDFSGHYPDTIICSEILSHIHKLSTIVQEDIAQRKKELESLDNIFKIIKKNTARDANKTQNKLLIQSKYMTTKHAAIFLDVDPSFLTKRKKNGKLKERKHWVNPPNETILRWHMANLENWFFSKESKPKTNDELDSFIKRTVK